jgi:hypothetical protein
MTIIVGSAQPGLVIREFRLPIVQEITPRPAPSGGSAW